MPPKPPLLKTQTTSPPATPLVKWLTMASASGKVGGVLPAAAQRLHNFSGRAVPPAVSNSGPGHLREHHGVGVPEGLGQFVLEDIAAGGVAARLEDGPDLLVRVAQPQGAEGLPDGGGVMPKIIQDRDARRRRRAPPCGR